MQRIFNLVTRKLHKRIALLALIGFVCAVIFDPSIAQAQADADLNSVLNNINIYVNVLLRSLSAIFWPILLMIGSLLDNGLIFGGSMEERLLSAWVEIRNLVNIIFVLILVAIAIYNVLGLGQDGGPLPLAYKSIMPKFVLALLVVNFSFLGVKVVLDLSNVVTGAVFALPTKTIQSEGQLIGEMENAICSKRSKEIPVYQLWCTSERKFNEKAKNYFNQLDRNNIAVVYAIRYGKATELKFIREGIKDLGQLGFNIIFNTILFTVYTVSFLVLFLVLATRLVVIWLALVMSPLYAVTLVLPNLASQLSGGAGNIGQKLIKSITAPIIIGLALSIGYIMLDALSADSSIDPLLSSSNLTAIDPNALPTNITSLQQLLIAIGSVVVVWTGVFAGASDTFAAGITDALKGRVLEMGKFLAKLPLYTQIIPVGGKRQSIKSVETTLDDIKGRFERKYGASFAPPEGSNGVPGQAYVEVKNALGQGWVGFERILKQFPNYLMHSAAWKEIKDFLIKNGVKKEDVEKLPETPDKASVNQLVQILKQNTDKASIREVFKRYDESGVAGGSFETAGTRLAEAILNKVNLEAPKAKDDIFKEIKDSPETALSRDYLGSDPTEKDNMLKIVKKLEAQPTLRDGLIDVDPSGVLVKKSEDLTEVNAEKILNFFVSLNQAPRDNPEALKAAITAATQGAGDDVSKDLMKQVLQLSDLQAESKKIALMIIDPDHKEVE